MIDVVQNTLDGLAIGSAYGLLALGFTLIFGVMRRLNMAFGSSILVGIFAGAWLHGQWAAGMIPIFAATLAGAVLAAAYVERLSFAWIRGDAALASMASSFALWMQLEDGIARAFPQRSYAFPSFDILPLLELGPLLLRPEFIAMFLTAAVLVVALHLMLTRTVFGLQVRTLSESREAARVSGVNVGRVAFLTFCIAAAIGGVAGFLIAATDGQISTKLGLWITMKGLIAMVISGLGSLRGALIGGLVLGLVEAQAQWYLGASGREITVFALLFVALILLPQGLAGRADAAARNEALRRL
ncbi:branched-chain amino acid ABC transporter permease [Jannaschia seohaensis]|uniref:Branched-chain amino acid transport system permease protein n=1 Tax=Jannaschia seohaensis TaxID=475081 RepID=A0A2Y9B1F9_9RHOB|nr:branched-chain amino acid ABC transporter permease [Jannaschia seohaensis]PWJ13827.1 branched-chain amino acid transport system permease protein [Jannaschia seohaensis]SSA50340.1 branched-chain amino acid transport system permease protein [Jannaschia seohaensis]